MFIGRACILIQSIIIQNSSQISIPIPIKYTIGFSIKGLGTENLLLPHRTHTQYKIKVNNCKLIDLVIRINWSNFNAGILKFSEKFDDPFSQFFLFVNMFLESHGFVAMPVTSCIKDACSNLSLSNIVKGYDIVQPFDRHSNETVTHEIYYQI